MKEKLKRNYKLIIGIVIGVIVSLGSTYATTTISSSDISYNNKDSGLTSTNMKGAIDELYEKVNNKPCKVIKGTGMDANDEIKCGTEEFYVMGTTGGDSIVTLTKYPIEGGIAYIDFVNQKKILIDNPSYSQNEQCGRSDFACWDPQTGFLDKYKSILTKIGLSDSIEVKQPSVSDLNKVGCSFSYSLDQYGNPISTSGSCERFPWLSEVFVSDAAGNNSKFIVASHSALNVEGLGSSGGVGYFSTVPRKLMVKVGIQDISL